MAVKTMEPKRIRVVPSPVCPVHGYPMSVGKVTTGVRHWYCPHPLCSESCKQSATIRIYQWVKCEQDLHDNTE